MLTFCTLFDSNYLDKGLVLYDSLDNVLEDFVIYILAMDDRCHKIIEGLKLSHAVIISLDSFEDEELKEIKSKRSWAEYCWTCTASLIDYVFETYAEQYCTYIDSDLYFYQSPEILIEEMILNQCSVQVVKHGFGKRAKEKEKKKGKYCVQFNTFKNDSIGRKILGIWKKQCRNHCSMEPGEMGDQKYITDWAEKYEKVHVLEHQGGGGAPWNIERYKYIQDEGKCIMLMDKRTKRIFELVFYHFHNLEYLDEQRVNINVNKSSLCVDKKLVEKIYIPYLKEINCKKQLLSDRFDFVPIIFKHSGMSSKPKQKISERIKGKRMDELWNMLIVKMVYLLGKKRDIINLKNLN